jgi:Tat protein secretion system quality control protein TatD with DNase activity
MIDIGLNLTSSQFAGEQADLVERARAAGVEALILTGTDLAGSRESAALAARWPGYCFSTAGVHPHDAKSVDEATLPALRELAALPQVVAIGECGLDYNRDFSPRPVQDAVFDAQLALAAELGMPVFLHCRDAACLTLPAEILKTILHDGIQVAHQHQRNADICADLLQLAEKFAERHAVAQGLCGCVLNDRTVGHRVAKRDTDFNHLYSFPL